MPRAKATKLSDVTQVDAEDVTTEEHELVGFLDNLGPQGISEVTLYRILPNGKQRFVTSGPPGQFSEQYIQVTYGGGDYLVRAKLNGKWFRSKNFSIEGAPINGNGNGGLRVNTDSDLERMKIDLEAQRLKLQEQQTQMEADRQARDQRNHELQLALIESSRHTAAPAVTVPEMIAGIKSLKELSSGQDEILSSMEKSLGIIERISNIRGAGGGGEGGGGWMDWLKPIAVEAGRQLVPRVIPFLTPAAPPAAAAASPPAPAAIETTSASPPAPPEPAPPSTPEPTPEEQYLFNKRQAIAFILPIARMGREPGFWAESAIEQVETTNNPVIARFLDEIVKAESFDVWFAELQAIDPTIITSRAWFAAFFEAMRESLNERAANDGREQQ